MPISFKPSSSRPPGTNILLKDSICGSMVAARTGYAVLSVGGFAKSFCRLAVSNSTDHCVCVFDLDLDFDFVCVAVEDMIAQGSMEKTASELDVGSGSHFTQLQPCYLLDCSERVSRLITTQVQCGSKHVASQKISGEAIPGAAC